MTSINSDNSNKFYYTIQNNEIVKTDKKKNFNQVMRHAIKHFSTTNELNLNDVTLLKNLNVKCQKLKDKQEKYSNYKIIGWFYKIINHFSIELRKKLEQTIENSQKDYQNILEQPISPFVKFKLETIKPKLKEEMREISDKMEKEKEYLKEEDLISDKNPSLDSTRAMILKKSPESNSLLRDMPGLKEIGHSIERFKAIKTLLKEVRGGSTSLGISSDEEIEGLIRIAKMRLINVDLVSKSKFFSKNQMRELLKHHLNELSNDESDKTVKLPDGSSTFGYLGAWRAHAIGYQFKKNNDGTYSFFIHNRGQGCSDPRIHGNFLFNHNDHIFRKTTVEIRTDFKTLQNDDFLNILLQGSQGEPHPYVYDNLFNFFIKEKRGIIVKSQDEIELEELRVEQMMTNAKKGSKLHEQIYKKLKESPEFHTQQLYGTCIESNSSALERGLAPDTTRYAIRIHSYANRINKLKTKFLKNDQLKDKELSLGVIYKGSKIIDKLKEKLLEQNLS